MNSVCSSLSSSPMSSPLARRVIAPLSRGDRVGLAVIAAKSKRKTANEVALIYGVNRGTVARRIKGSRNAADYGLTRRLLDDSEEQSILNYIDSSTALGFPARFDMIREKVMKLLRLRVESSASLGINWTKRFLDRYSDYRSRYPRHLDQERHWNTDRKVFEDWFSLVRRTMDKYGIATGDVYNMDEKGHLMGVAGNIR